MVIFPSYVFKYEEFRAKVVELRSLIDSVPVPPQRVPVHDLPDFMSRVYKLIEMEQHLNIPDQEIILARHKCSEATENAF